MDPIISKAEEDALVLSITLGVRRLKNLADDGVSAENVLWEARKMLLPLVVLSIQMDIPLEVSTQAPDAIVKVAEFVSGGITISITSDHVMFSEIWNLSSLTEAVKNCA